MSILSQPGTPVNKTEPSGCKLPGVRLLSVINMTEKVPARVNTQTPFTNFWTAKNLHGSAFSLRATRGTVKFLSRLSQNRSHGFLVWCGRTRHERLLSLAARQIYRRKIPPVMLSNQAALHAASWELRAKMTSLDVILCKETKSSFRSLARASRSAFVRSRYALKSSTCDQV